MDKIKSAFFWLPRILTIIFILFVSLFALDVFGMGGDFWATLGGLAIHLIPSFFMIIVLWATWRRPWIGGIFFILLGFVYFFLTSGNFLYRLPIGAPLFLIGFLFGLEYFKSKNRQHFQRP